MNSISFRKENNVYMKLVCIEKNNSTSVLKHILEQKNFPYYRRVSVHDGQRKDLFVECTIHSSTENQPLYTILSTFLH